MSNVKARKQSNTIDVVKNKKIKVQGANLEELPLAKFQTI